MDIATIVGLIAAIGLIVGSMIMGTAPLSAYIDIPSVLVVIGGSMAAALICFPLKSMIGSPKVALKVVLNKTENLGDLIVQLVALAETARRDGLLALESKIADISNPLVRTGIQMAVDGSTPEAVEEVLRTEVTSLSQRHKEGKALMDQMGRFAPAYGMIGTLMGLIMMLSDMSDPSGIGAGMAVALITTLYGAIMANVFFSPFAEKLGFLSKQEMLATEIAIRGVLAIQSGESPRASTKNYKPLFRHACERRKSNMDIEEDPPVGIPEWVVTFGDMMSLLLTFFIMLVSLSEIKEEDKYQALVESMRQQFGYSKSMESFTPGESTPRTTAFQVLATTGRAKQKDVAKGGTEVKSPHGEEDSVRIIRQGQRTAIGSVIFFESGSEVLTDTAKRELDLLADQLRGKPQKIEVRGHTAPEVAARTVDTSQSLELAFRRSLLVRKYLVEKQQLEPFRFLCTSAGEYEPMDRSGAVEKMSMNPRVEVFLLDENAEDLSNNKTQRQPIVDDPSTGAP